MRDRYSVPSPQCVQGRHRECVRYRGDFLLPDVCNCRCHHRA